MFARIAILLLTCCSLCAIPRGSNRDELQRLARTPRIEFSSPLDFNRIAGFRVFPDRAGMAKKSAELLNDARRVPSDAPKVLEAARLHEQSQGRLDALKLYTQAADLFRQFIEIHPADSTPLIGLADCLDALGRFSESESLLLKAAALSTNNAASHAALGRHHQEQAWRIFAGHLALHARAAITHIARSVRGISSERMRQTRENLRLALSHFDKAVELDPQNPAYLLQRSTFRSLDSLVQAALNSIQSSDSVRLEQKLFSPAALDDLKKAARLSPDPETIAAIALIEVNYAGATLDDVRPWLATLQSLAASDNLQTAAAASDMFGCLQFSLIEDWDGAARSFRQSLSLDPAQNRPWDMLILCHNAANDFPSLIEHAKKRAALVPTARNHVLLAKAHERARDLQRAQLAALDACALAPNDFLANLSLAALLLKDRDSAAYAWRIKESLNRAKKHIGPEPPLINQIDLAFTTTLFHALQGDLDKARQTLAGLPPASRHTPEIQELTRLLRD